MNTVKTVFLMTLMTLLLMWVGNHYGGVQGMTMGLLFAGGVNLFTYWFSDKIALASNGAREVSEAEAPELHSIVRGLATRAGIPMPRVYIIPSMSPNAFATGRNPAHAAVAVTQGILQLLSRDELEGVIGHELAHVQHRDILLATIVATMAGVITWVARMAGYGLMFGGYGGRDRRDNGLAGLVMMIVAPIAALLIQLSISRAREYDADAGGARIAGTPVGLANALEKLERGVQAVPMNVNPSSAHLFIVNPLSGKSLMALFSTHPPLVERIARLRSMPRA